MLCSQNEWKLETYSSKAEKVLLHKENQLQLVFKLPHGRYYIKQQYYLHDSSTFIADVGGYLGLLLGHSALGIIYMMVEHCAKKN